MSVKITIELDRDTAVLLRAWLGDLLPVDVCPDVRVTHSTHASFSVLHRALVDALTVGQESYVDASRCPRDAQASRPGEWVTLEPDEELDSYGRVRKKTAAQP